MPNPDASPLSTIAVIKVFGTTRKLLKGPQKHTFLNQGEEVSPLHPPRPSFSKKSKLLKNQVLTEIEPIKAKPKVGAVKHVVADRNIRDSNTRLAWYSNG